MSRGKVVHAPCLGTAPAAASGRTAGEETSGRRARSLDRVMVRMGSGLAQGSWVTGASGRGAETEQAAGVLVRDTERQDRQEGK